MPQIEHIEVVGGSWPAKDATSLAAYDTTILYIVTDDANSPNEWYCEYHPVIFEDLRNAAQQQLNVVFIDDNTNSGTRAIVNRVNRNRSVDTTFHGFTGYTITRLLRSLPKKRKKSAKVRK